MYHCAAGFGLVSTSSSTIYSGSFFFDPKLNMPHPFFFFGDGIVSCFLSVDLPAFVVAFVWPDAVDLPVFGSNAPFSTVSGSIAIMFVDY